MSTAALLANLLATTVMVGIIWFVQIVHYPLLARFGADAGVAVAHEHQRRTGFVVAAPMAVEGTSTLALLVAAPDGVSGWLPWAGALLLAVALGCTVLLSVPLHARMAAGHDPSVGRRLVRTNWPRTVAWTARGAVCTVMCAQALGA
jgi:hypothetical protein